ncbi:Protein of unknown function [Gryllus bimaculatus]|nr:Protein of unknown function [Gryllus bimaculatus]
MARDGRRIYQLHSAPAALRTVTVGRRGRANTAAPSYTSLQPTTPSQHEGAVATGVGGDCRDGRVGRGGRGGGADGGADGDGEAGRAAGVGDGERERGGGGGRGLRGRAAVALLGAAVHALPQGRAALPPHARRTRYVARHANQADAGALEFPGLALARVDRPFALGAALRPAPVLAGALDDARRPLRCSIEGWKVQKQSAHETAADLANFTEPIKTTIGVDGGALLCAGALVGMHYSPTRYNTSLASFFHLFTNASDLQLWLGIHVPALKLVVSNGDGALVDLAPKHGSVAKSAGAAATQALFLPVAAAAAALVLWRQFALVRL